MRKRTGNAVKPLPACVDGLLGPYLDLTPFLLPEILLIFDQSSPGIAWWVFYIWGSNLPQRWVRMFRILRPFKREKILKTVRDICFFPNHVLSFSLQLVDYPRIRRHKDVLGQNKPCTLVILETTVSSQ